jgi:hypothetical protein
VDVTVLPRAPGKGIPMKDMIHILLPMLAVLLAMCLALAACSRSTSDSKAPAQNPAAKLEAQPEPQSQQRSGGQQARPDIEQERKNSQEETQKTLDQDAIAAIQATQRAVDAIANNKSDEALTRLEEATGKINILLARNPANALIPVKAEVDIIDTAPEDTKAILDIAKDASRAVDGRDFPTARVLLYSLMSEIRNRAYNLPLATYPAALQQAARLLDEKKNQDASNILLTALNTLVVIDHVTPLPLVLARTAIEQAQAQAQKDKNGATQLLETAKHELERSKDLGYSGNDPEYAGLNKEIANLEKQLKGNGDMTAMFTKFKDRLSAFVKRFSERQRR